jgi:hypothetical protein
VGAQKAAYNVICVAVEKRFYLQQEPCSMNANFNQRVDGILSEPIPPRQYHGGFVEQQECFYNIQILVAEAFFGP